MARIFGDGGPNRLRGTGKADLLKSNGGPDELFGRAGNDKLHGGTRKDLLQGGAGQDKLWGGPDGDVFRFKVGDAVPSSGKRDTIYDFQSGIDFIDLPNAFSGVVLVELVGVGTIVTYNGGSEEILVLNKLPSQLSNADFF